MWLLVITRERPMQFGSMLGCLPMPAKGCKDDALSDCISAIRAQVFMSAILVVVWQSKELKVYTYKQRASVRVYKVVDY